MHDITSLIWVLKINQSRSSSVHYTKGLIDYATVIKNQSTVLVLLIFFDTFIFVNNFIINTSCDTQAEKPFFCTMADVKYTRVLDMLWCTILWYSSADSSLSCCVMFIIVCHAVHDVQNCTVLYEKMV